MSSIYIYDGPFERGDGGYPLIKEAAARYAAEKGLDFDFYKGDIQRSDKGKPFFVDGPVEFSLSHSGIMWMCMLSHRPCGLDLQVMKDCDYEKLAQRFYTPQECHYVELWGQDGFFDVWVRKEAFAKCTGKGFFSHMPSMADENTDLVSSVEHGGVTYYFEEVEISPEMKCAVCTTEKDTVELRILG